MYCIVLYCIVQYILIWKTEKQILEHLGMNGDNIKTIIKWILYEDVN